MEALIRRGPKNGCRATTSPVYFSTVNDCSPVMALPRISAWMSWVPVNNNEKLKMFTQRHLNYLFCAKCPQIRGLLWCAAVLCWSMCMIAVKIWKVLLLFCHTFENKDIYLSVFLPSYVLTASRFMAWRITWYSSEMPFPPSMSLACLAISKALPQLFLFSIEIISGAALLERKHTLKEKRCLPKTENFYGRKSRLTSSDQ